MKMPGIDSIQTQAGDKVGRWTENSDPVIKILDLVQSSNRNW